MTISKSTACRGIPCRSLAFSPLVATPALRPSPPPTAAAQAAGPNQPRPNVASIGRPRRRRSTSLFSGSAVLALAHSNGKKPSQIASEPCRTFSSCSRRHFAMHGSNRAEMNPISRDEQGTGAAHGDQTNLEDQGEEAGGSRASEEAGQTNAGQTIGQNGHLDQPAGRAIQGKDHRLVPPAWSLASAGPQGRVRTMATRR